MNQFFKYIICVSQHRPKHLKHVCVWCVDILTAADKMLCHCQWGKHSCCWWVGCSGLSVAVSILVFDCLRNSLLLNGRLCRRLLLQVPWASILGQIAPSVTFCDLRPALSGLWRAYLTICWTLAMSSMAWHHWNWWRAWTCTPGSLPSSTCTGTAEAVSWVTSFDLTDKTERDFDKHPVAWPPATSVFFFSVWTRLL